LRVLKGPSDRRHYHDVTLEPHPGEKAIDWWIWGLGFLPLPIFLEHLGDAVYSFHGCLGLAANMSVMIVLGFPVVRVAPLYRLYNPMGAGIEKN